MAFEFEGYKIGGRLSDNKQVAVYRAVKEKMLTPVVIKAIRIFSKPKLLTSKRVRDQCHVHPLPSIVEPLEIRVPPSSGDPQGFSFYIVLEYLHGGSLRDRLAIPRDPGEALYLAQGIARALKDLYGWEAQHLPLHGNLHPGNVLFRANDQIALSDICPHNVAPSSAAIPYLSPEQVQEIQHGQNKGACVDFRSDFFSLGTLLFEMLTGKKAFPVEDLEALEVLHEKIPQLPRHLSDLQPLIDQLLAKEPEKRFSSDQELLAALEAASEHYPTHQEEEHAEDSEEPTPPKQKEVDGEDKKDDEFSPIKGALIGSSLALIALAGGFFLFSSQESPTDQQGATPEKPLVANTGEEKRDFLSTPPKEQQPLAVFDGEKQAAKTPVKPETESAAASPENTQAVEAQRRLQQIEGWLKTAQNALAAGKLLYPEGENAYFAYQQVLKLYPEHAGAQEGLKTIGDRLAAQTRALFEQGKLDQSLAQVNQGLAVLPKHAGLLDLQREIRTVQQQAEARAERIAALLAAGDRQLAENRLTRPPGNNALESYEEVLKLDPENERAKAGIDAIADRYQKLAQDALDRKDYNEALSMVARGLEIRDQHAGLLQLQSTVSEQQRLEEERRRQIAAQKARERAEQERLRREQARRERERRLAEERKRKAAEKKRQQQQAYQRRLAEEKARQQAERERRQREQEARRRAEEKRRQQQQAVQPKPEPVVKKPEFFPSF